MLRFLENCCNLFPKCTMIYFDFKIEIKKKKKLKGNNHKDKIKIIVDYSKLKQRIP